MRGKCSDRRKAIIAVATGVFCEQGYSQATMSEIAARMGGSKGTLWTYFRSKEELFAASMASVSAQWAKLADILADTDANISAVLHGFCHAYLQLATSADALMIRRTIIGNYGLSEFSGVDFLQPVWKMAGDYLADQKNKGTIRSVDPRIAARVLIAVLEAGYVEPLLLGIQPEIDETDAVANAIDFFQRAYSTSLEQRSSHRENADRLLS